MRYKVKNQKHDFIDCVKIVWGIVEIVRSSEEEVTVIVREGVKKTKKLRSGWGG